MAGTVTVACKIPSGLNLGFVTVNGSNHPSAIGGFGLTPNVDADKFEKWAADHAKLPAVAKGLIFAQNKREVAVAQARELKDVKTGFEAIDPEKPGDGVEPSDQQKKDLGKQRQTREERQERAAAAEEAAAKE